VLIVRDAHGQTFAFVYCRRHTLPLGKTPCSWGTKLSSSSPSIGQQCALAPSCFIAISLSMRRQGLMGTIRVRLSG
jgi:hypothetical protein